jgi:hypothetical protein
MIGFFLKVVPFHSLSYRFMPVVCPASEVHNLILDTLKLLVMKLSMISLKLLKLRGYTPGGAATPNV